MALAQLKAALLHLSFDRSRKWLRESENLTHSIFITKGKLFEIIFRLEFFSGHWTSNTHNSLQWTFLTSQLRTNTFCIDTHVIWVIFYFYQMFASIWGEDNTMIINTGPYTFIFWWNSAQGVFLRKVNNLLPWILGPPPPGFVILKGVWNPLWSFVNVILKRLMLWGAKLFQLPWSWIWRSILECFALSSQTSHLSFFLHTDFSPHLFRTKMA